MTPWVGGDLKFLPSAILLVFSAVLSPTLITQAQNGRASITQHKIKPDTNTETLTETQDTQRHTGRDGHRQTHRDRAPWQAYD